MRRTRARRGTTAALVTTALLTLATVACSSDGEGDDAATEPSTTAPEEPAGEEEPTEPPADPEEAAALEQAVRQYTDAYFAPDADAAYEMLSSRCQAAITPEIFADTVEQGAGDYGRLEVEGFTVDELSGDTARVTYSVGLPIIDEALTGQPWSREDGEWRFDAC